MKFVILPMLFASMTFAINYHGCALAPDNVHGWVVAIDTVLILYTTDGGTTWTPQDVPPDIYGRRLFDVTCLDDTLAWTTGKHNLHAAEILHTSDGGDYWYRQVAGFSKYGTRIEMLDQNYGIAVGGDGTIAQTTDGGIWWQQVMTDWLSAEYYGVSIINQWDSWICAGWPDSLAIGQGYIVPTNDGGITWDTLNGYHAAGYEDFFDIHFFNNLEGIVVGGNESDYSPLIWKTTDGGSTWNPISTPGNSYYLRAVDFVGNEGWAVGRFGTIIHTTDSGNSWTGQTSPATTTLFDVDFTDNLHGIACGYDHILVTTDGGQNWQHVGIQENTAAAPATVALSAQPNPFSNITQIKYSILDSRYLIQEPTLRIYDANGRLVRSFHLVSSIQNPGSVVQWDGTDNTGKRLAPGVYFAELKTPREVHCAKLVLLKQ
jgi:photosystem II stability/assembly factor-like uncharacterized protein